MSQLRAFDLTLAPHKRGGMFVVYSGEIADRLLQLLGTTKAGAGQGLSGEDAEPNLHLVKPACRSRREVESDIGVSGKPSFVLLMGTVVVEDDVDLAIGGLVFDNLGHEGLEVDALFGLCGLAADKPGGNFQGGKEVDRAVPLVSALEALDDLTAAGLNIAGRPLQGAGFRSAIRSSTGWESLPRRLRSWAAQTPCFCRWIATKQAGEKDTATDS